MIIFASEPGHSDPELGQLLSERRRYGAPAGSCGPLQIVSHAQVSCDLRGFCMPADRVDELHRARAQDL